MEHQGITWSRWFPFLTEQQIHQWQAAKEAFVEWNQKINVISRKDIDSIDLHHAAHSFCIAQLAHFSPGSRCFDIGTGGGFPGIPLAIAFPETEFVLVDSIGKKLKVAQAAADAAGLKNVRTIHIRAEQLKEKGDYITGRAVRPLFEFYRQVKHLFKQNTTAAQAGIWYLKGPEPEPLFAGFQQKPQRYALHEELPMDWFAEKTLWHIPLAAPQAHIP